METKKKNVSLSVVIGVVLLVVAALLFFLAGSGSEPVQTTQEQEVTAPVRGDMAVTEEAPVEEFAEEPMMMEGEDAMEAGEDYTGEEAEGMEEALDEEAVPAEGEEGTAVEEGEEAGTAEGEEEAAAEGEETEYACDFSEWVGQNVANVDFNTLDRPYRVLETGSMYTTDHVPARVNVHTDEEGNIVQVTCG